MSTEAGHDLPYEVTPTNLPGAYASVAPLDDFDPRTATPAELARHGIMVRPPGPDDPAAVRAAWDTVFSRVWRAQDRIIPTLEPQVGRTHKARGAKRVSDTSFTSDNWSGAAIQGDWTLAIGYWVVPEVTEPGEPQGLEGGWNSASWVGIDGAYGSDDVLQAGVEQRVDSSGNASYTPWFEWFAPRYPNSPAYIFQTNISGFTVSPGDTVYCAAQYGGPEAPAAIPGSPLDGYATDWNDQQHVNYIWVDGHVHEYYTGAGTWQYNDLSAAAGATGFLPGPGSPLDGYATDWNSQQHVNYIGADGHVHELFYSSSPFVSAGWRHNDLSVAAGATGSLPGPGSRLDGYATDWNSQQHVNYADANGQVHELLYTSSNGWQHNDLTALAGQSEFGPFTFPGAVAASPLAGDPTDWNSQQHVTYIGVDGHVHELNNSPANGSGANGGWEENDLTAVAGRTGVIYFANDTTHHYFSITLEPPPAASCSGACAEWIMEAPDGGEPTSSLPKFTPVTFTSAICCGPDGLGNPENGDTWNIVASGTTLTSVKTGDDTVTIDYIGP
jgi:hypothetical protein